MGTEIIETDTPNQKNSFNGTSFDFEDRIPLEEAVLGCLVLSWPNDQYIQAIDPHWFYDLTNRRLFEFLRKSRETNMPVDPVARWHDLTAFEKRRLFIDAYQAVTSVAMLPYYVGEIRKAFVAKESKRVILGCDGELDADERRRLKALLDQAEATSDDSTFATPAQLMPEVLEQIEQRVANRDKGPEYPTYPGLDEKTDGLHPGELWVVGAYTSVGKTLFLSTMAKRLTDAGKRVAYFTTEMQKTEYLRTRWLPSFSGVHAVAIRCGSLTNVDWNKLTVGAGKMSELPLWVIDTSRPSLGHIQGIMRQIRPDVLFLDHIHRCELPKAENQNLALTMFVSGLKTMARDLNIPLVAAAQLNRQSQLDTKPPSLAHLRDSGSLEMESDVVVLLSRLYDGGEPRPVIRGEIAKNRHGELGTVNFKIVGAEMTVSEMQPWELEAMKTRTYGRAE
jgi:replicative DNA helicase